MQVSWSTRGNKLQNLAAKKLVQHYKLEGLNRPAERLDKPAARPSYPPGVNTHDPGREDFHVAPANFGRKGTFRTHTLKRTFDARRGFASTINEDVAHPKNYTIAMVDTPYQDGDYHGVYQRMEQVPIEGLMSPKNPPRLGRSKKRARD